MMQPRPTSHSNPLVEMFARPNWSLPAKPERVETLILAHDEPLLMRRLIENLPRESYALLVVPQSQWDLQNPALAAAVRTALRELPARHLIALGHSLGGAPGSHPPPELEGRPARSPHRMAHSERANVESHLIHQHNALRQLCTAERGDRFGPFPVDTFLFRSESGSFVAYNEKTGRFTAIPSEEVMP